MLSTDKNSGTPQTYYQKPNDNTARKEKNRSGTNSPKTNQFSPKVILNNENEYPTLISEKKIEILKKEKNNRYNVVTEKISSLQQKIGALTSDFNMGILNQSMMPGQNEEGLLETTYGTIFKELQKATEESLEMNTFFEPYFTTLHEKILVDQQMNFQIPQLYLKTIAYVLNPISADEIQMDLDTAKGKCDKRIKRFKEILLKRITIEDELYKATHAIYSKAVGIGPSPFSESLKLTLAKLRNNAWLPSSIKVSPLQDWFVKASLAKKREEVKAFVESAQSLRRIYREMSEQGASADPNQIAIHYRTIKEQYLDLSNRSHQLYRMMLNVQEKLKKEVDAWDNDPHISDYQLQRMAIVLNTTEVDLKKEKYDPYLKAHLERKQRLVKINNEINAFEDNFKLAMKEVNRMYDCLKRDGTHITELRFNAGGWADPDIVLPFGPLEQPKPQEATSVNNTKVGTNTGGQTTIPENHLEKNDTEDLPTLDAKSAQDIKTT